MRDWVDISCFIRAMIKVLPIYAVLIGLIYLTTREYPINHGRDDSQDDGKGDKE